MSSNIYAISRSADGRPTTMHELPDGQATYTSCGISMAGWSRYFIPPRLALGALRGMLCGNCARRKSQKPVRRVA